MIRLFPAFWGGRNDRKYHTHAHNLADALANPKQSATPHHGNRNGYISMIRGDHRRSVHLYLAAGNRICMWSQRGGNLRWRSPPTETPRHKWRGLWSVVVMQATQQVAPPYQTGYLPDVIPSITLIINVQHAIYVTAIYVHCIYSAVSDDTA